ncbi:MAG: hypothetical protein GF346_03365 [Candidatus Eisenbacteria bacterium]|nr:hypothetical protein [Candidatus Latescibacterota bacterium]MBD3301461.1 hypothetical protein [Candidatus Eisenbacteria bacterium]
MDREKRIPLLFGGVLVASLFLMVFLVEISQRHQEKVDAIQEKEAARAQRIACAESGVLFAPVVEGAEHLGEPFASSWKDRPRIGVKVNPQAVTMPMLREASIDSLWLQAVVVGSEIVWRVTWRDSTPDWNVDANRFTDAVAIQFPLTPSASFMMGAARQRVQIFHWKALWQKDVDEHFQDVQDLHPNYWTDMYWFASGSHPYPVPEAFEDPRSHAWFAAYAAGNPVADFRRKQPVEELIAEGFGTLTHQPECAARARGAWKDGRWAVLFRRPLRTEDPQDYPLDRGWRGKVSLAVWEGSAGNVGGRKHWSDWLEFEVQQ